MRRQGTQRWAVGWEREQDASSVAALIGLEGLDTVAGESVA
jgi:hypothetical protein